MAPASRTSAPIAHQHDDCAVDRRRFRDVLDVLFSGHRPAPAMQSVRVDAAQQAVRNSPRPMPRMATRPVTSASAPDGGAIR